MSHFDHGPLATYNSLTDTHLAGFFANTRKRRHLVKSGLVSRNGVIVSEATYRLNMSRKEHKKYVKDMLAQAIVHKTLDLERTRQAEIKKKLEEIAKIQLVQRVRASRGRKGDEEILPLLTLKAGRPYSSPTSKPRGRSPNSKYRPYSAPGARPDSRFSQTSTEDDGDVLYLDDEGQPITSHRELGSNDHIDTRHLYSLDTAALRKYAMMMSQMEQGRGLSSPYLMPRVPLPPRFPLSGRSLRSARYAKSTSPQRPVTTDGHISRLHRPEGAKMHEGQQESMCKITMKYHGWDLHLAREQMDPTQEIQVEQQHCGGNTLTVFKERLVPGSEFSFISYRHRGYPFSLTLYVDGHVDSRVSTCCEDRHSPGAKIGGKQGHFSIICVDGAVPCYKCQVAKGVMIQNKAPCKQKKRPPESHAEEVIVVSSTKDKSDKSKAAVNRSESPHDNPDEKPVRIAVEKEDDNEQYDKNADKVDKDNYDDDFETSGSSPLSSSRSSSESESEKTPGRKDDGSRGKDDESAKSESETESASSAWSEREEERYKAKKGHSPTEPKSRESPTSKPKSPESPTSKPKSPESPTSKPKSRESPTTELKSRESPTSKPKSRESPMSKPKSRESPMSKPKSRESPTTELKSRESPTSRGTFRRAADRSAGRMDVNGTGRKIDDFSSDEDENGDKKTTVLSMEAVDAEEVKPPKKSSRSKSSSSSSSSSADSSDEREKEEQKKTVVVSMQPFSDEEVASEKAAAEKENREKRRQKEAEESQQQRKREIEELRKAEEERRQREKSEERKREEERRQREEEKRAEAQREAERKTEERRREEAAQRRPDSVTSADEQSKEEARLKAQQLREAEILEGQRQREERRRVEERERVEAWRRQQAQREEEIRNVENRREERRQEEGVSSARSTPTSSSFAKSFSLASESDTDHSQKHAAREKMATQGQHKELDKSVVSPPKELDSPASAKKMSGEEKSPKGKRATPVNYLESEDQPSTAPASSRTVESGRSSRSNATSDSSSSGSSSDSDSDSDGDSESDNEGIVDKSSKTPPEEMKQTAAESQAEDKKLAPQVEGKETKISAEVYAAPLLWSPKLDKAKEEISDSSSSDGESPSGRSSSRVSGHNDTAKTQTSPERAAHVRMPLLTSDGVVNSRSRLTDDAVEEEGDGPAHVLPEEAELKMDDEAEHRLRPPSAMMEQQPSSFSSLDEEIWKSEQGRGGKQQTSDSDDEFVINGDRPGIRAERETSREESLEMTDDRPEATSPENSWRERLVGEDTVELPNVSLTKTQVQELASHLEVAEKVNTVNLRNTGLNDEDLQKVTEAIAASLSEVEMLNLSLNSLTEESVPHLLHVLKAKPSVKLLLLHGNRLGDVGVGQLVAGLQGLHREARTQRMTKASEPSADSVSLDSTASSLAQSSLPSRYILRDLDLAGTGIGDEGAERIGELLGGNVYVEALRLSSNEGVTAEGGWARIGEGIAKNRCLKSLALDGNRIGDVGVKHLARGLFKNHTLTSLKLQNAGIGEDGAKAIMEMLKRNTTLQDLTLTPGNAISEELMNDINNYVALNRASGTALSRR
ncbi:glutamate-rich protein 3-like isoform X2 [Pomacea canaliculata]|uniref:glutamate-rich protein 3-like isoform X2 n=1 Tax=Pomacea canaliculata TaxID=400727 RepID=UPI000D733CED|nr:glutamate-rich protein 3-like isoform X2 [Pomacea canaliculata]